MLGVYVELGMRDTLLDIKFNRIKLFVHVFFIIIVNIARNDTLYLIYVIILLSLFGRSSSLLVISFALTVLRYFSTAANLEIPQMASVALLQYPYTPTLTLSNRGLAQLNAFRNSVRARRYGVPK